MSRALAMTERACPLCGATDQSRVVAESTVETDRLDGFAFASRKLPEYMHHRLLTCASCDLVYASPIPSSDSLAKAYEEAAFDSSNESLSASRTYGRFLPALVEALPDLVGAVDVGTGDGAF